MTSEDTDEEYNTREELLLEEAHTKEPRMHPFLAMLSFLLAAILLIYFFSPLLDSLLKMLLLGGAIIFGMLGVLLWEKRATLPLSTTTSPTHTQETAIDSEEAPELTAFEQLVREALDTIPPEFHEQMENLVVLVEDEPDSGKIEKLYETDEPESGGLLLGLYQGVPLTHQSHSQTRLPERITIYQHNIERYCHNDPERIRDQVRSTVLHEVAHHFGMDHHDMPIWVR